MVSAETRKVAKEHEKWLRQIIRDEIEKYECEKGKPRKGIMFPFDPYEYKK